MNKSKDNRAVVYYISFIFYIFLVLSLTLF